MGKTKLGARRRGNYHIEIDHATCVQCAGCVSICPTEALHMHALELVCHDPDCIGCDLCVRFCPVVALDLQAVRPVAVDSPHSRSGTAPAAAS